MVETSAGEFQRAHCRAACKLMLASANLGLAQGAGVKKGIVAILVVLALVLLVSPGIIGQLAERSVDNSLERAVQKSGDLVITSSGFDSGWFTSAGQHRVQLREGDLYEALLDSFDELQPGALPVLLIDTRLDHGLIPLTSMQRANGSLMPGLGSAISTLSLEHADGSVTTLPGALYSTLGLGGELQSRLELTADSIAAKDLKLDWGDVEMLLRSNARTQDFGLHGTLQSLAIGDDDATAIIGRSSIAADLAQSGFGFTVGPVNFTLESFALVSDSENITAGPLSLQSHSSVDDGQLNADLVLRIDSMPLSIGGRGGDGSVVIAARLENVDAALLGQFKRSVDAVRDEDYEQLGMFDPELDLMQLLAAGLSLQIDQFDVNLPEGAITSRLDATLAATDADSFNWASAILALDASADISLPAALVEPLAQSDPQLQAVIAMGFLRKAGDFYVIEAAFRQGLLNVNGAPIPIPLSGLQ